MGDFQFTQLFAYHLRTTPFKQSSTQGGAEVTQELSHVLHGHQSYTLQNGGKHGFTVLKRAKKLYPGDKLSCGFIFMFAGD